MIIVITISSVNNIKSEKIFFNQLKVKRVVPNGKDSIFNIIGFQYGVEEVRHTGYAEDVTLYLNGYFGNRSE